MEQSRGRNWGEGKTRFLKSNTFLMVCAIVVVLIVGAIISDSFIAVFNLSRLVRQASIMGFLAIGMTFVIAGGNGGIDLSVGATLALSGMLAISMQSNLMTTTDLSNEYYGIEMPVVVIFIVCILAGMIVGYLNGAACAYLKVSPFIVTLCMTNIVRGCIMVYTGGNQFSGVRDDFKSVASTFVGDAIPVTFIILLAVAVIAYILLNKCAYGRKLFAVGANINAASISGIRTSRIQISTYMIAGAMAALGGVLLTSFSMSADPAAGDGYELDAISAVLIGGTPMSGGKGSVVSTLCGLLFIYLLKNLLKLLGINTYIQSMIVAVLIMIVVLVQERRQISLERGK